MLFHLIMVDTIHRFVQKVCGTELDIVYLTVAFRMNLFNNIRSFIPYESTATIRSVPFCMEVRTQHFLDLERNLTVMNLCNWEQRVLKD